MHHTLNETLWKLHLTRINATRQEQELAVLRAQEARAVEEASATAARAAVTARENYEKDAELSATKEALNTTQAELAAAQAELSGTQGDLAAARFTLNSSGAEAQQELNSMRFDLQAARTELNVTRAHLGTARAHTATASAKAETAEAERDAARHNATVQAVQAAEAAQERDAALANATVQAARAAAAAQALEAAKSQVSDLESRVQDAQDSAADDAADAAHEAEDCAQAAANATAMKAALDASREREVELESERDAALANATAERARAVHLESQMNVVDDAADAAGDAAADDAAAVARAKSALNASQSREAELEAELNASRAAEARSERAKDALDWKLRKTTAIMDAFESLLPGADNASATPNASNVSEPMTNASDTSFLNSTAPSSDAACKSSCDMSGTWVDGTGAEIGLVTDAANPCAGAHDGGAWTYTVTESASGTTITLSDGTVGTVGGSAPARTITWSNGITYTEQSESTISSCPSSCDVGGTWVDGTGAKIGMATDAANPCAGAEESGAWTYTVTVSPEGKKVTLSDGTVGTVGGSAPARTITWSNGITYTEETNAVDSTELPESSDAVTASNASSPPVRQEQLPPWAKERLAQAKAARDAARNELEAEQEHADMLESELEAKDDDIEALEAAVQNVTSTPGVTAANASTEAAVTEASPEAADATASAEAASEPASAEAASEPASTEAASVPHAGCGNQSNASEAEEALARVAGILAPEDSGVSPQRTVDSEGRADPPVRPEDVPTLASRAVARLRNAEAVADETTESLREVAELLAPNESASTAAQVVDLVRRQKDAIAAAGDVKFCHEVPGRAWDSPAARCTETELFQCPGTLETLRMVGMPADCEDRCVDHADCWGFWYYEVYGGTCTLFSADGVKGYGLPEVGKYPTMTELNMATKPYQSPNGQQTLSVAGVCYTLA